LRATPERERETKALGQRPAGLGGEAGSAESRGDRRERIVKLALTLLVLVLVLAAPASAQRSGGSAWAIEAAGGTLGSAAGFGLGLAIFDDDDCGDDLGCIFSDVAGVLVSASTGATLGTWALGRAADTGPSLGGAVLGSLVGAVAGLGAIKLLDEADPDLDEGAVAVIGFGVSQGAITALGSRIGAALR
jgi:hypothetical protein